MIRATVKFGVSDDGDVVAQIEVSSGAEAKSARPRAALEEYEEYDADEAEPDYEVACPRAVPHYQARRPEQIAPSPHSELAVPPGNLDRAMTLDHLLPAEDGEEDGGPTLMGASALVATELRRPSTATTASSWRQASKRSSLDMLLTEAMRARFSAGRSDGSETVQEAEEAEAADAEVQAAQMHWQEAAASNSSGAAAPRPPSADAAPSFGPPEAARLHPIIQNPPAPSGTIYSPQPLSPQSPKYRAPPPQATTSHATLQATPPQATPPQATPPQATPPQATAPQATAPQHPTPPSHPRPASSGRPSAARPQKGRGAGSCGHGSHPRTAERWSDEPPAPQGERRAERRAGCGHGADAGAGGVSPQRVSPQRKAGVQLRGRFLGLDAVQRAIYGMEAPPAIDVPLLATLENEYRGLHGQTAATLAASPSKRPRQCPSQSPSQSPSGGESRDGREVLAEQTRQQMRRLGRAFSSLGLS